jgi:hypothetical protein
VAAKFRRWIHGVAPCPQRQRPARVPCSRHFCRSCEAVATAAASANDCAANFKAGEAPRHIGRNFCVLRPNPTSAV